MGELHIARDLVYYQTGGNCDQLIQPHTPEELAENILRLHKDKTPYYILGGGTNSLVSDHHWQGAVIAFTNMKKIDVDSENTTLLVEAGVDNTVLAKKALELSWEGIAWMNRLPGQLGGTVRMNARCYGGEISQVVSEVYTVATNGKLKTYSSKDGIFAGYKDTVFMSNGDIITGAKINLKEGDPAKIKKTMDYCEQDRIGKGQFTFPPVDAFSKITMTPAFPVECFWIVPMLIN